LNDVCHGAITSGDLRYFSFVADSNLIDKRGGILGTRVFFLANFNRIKCRLQNASS